MVIVSWFKEQIITKWVAAREFLGWFAQFIIVRWSVAVGLACLTTFALLFSMQALIATGQQPKTLTNLIKIVDASMPELNFEIHKEFDRPMLIETIYEPPLEIHKKRVGMDVGPRLNISKEVISFHSEIILQNASMMERCYRCLTSLQTTPIMHS